MKDQSVPFAVVALLVLNACTMISTAPTSPVAPEAAAVSAPSSLAPLLKPAGWNELTGWTDDDILPAWDAFLRSCTVLKNQRLWGETCIEAAALRGQNGEMLRKFFETRFVPHQVLNSDGSEDGLITGYYEPLLKGSRKQSKRYRYPL